MRVTEVRPDQRVVTDENRWAVAKEILGNDRVVLGPVASHSWLHQPDHLAFQLARYRTAAALIGNAKKVLEVGAGEGIGASILASGRGWYLGVDPDSDAIEVARATQQGPQRRFVAGDTAGVDGIDYSFNAAVALDVIEHIPPEQEQAFMDGVTRTLTEHGILVIGTPSANAAHLASPQSRVGHVNLFTPQRLRDALAQRFHVVQMWGMQDVALHSGHEEMWHYIIGAGYVPR